MRDGLIPRLLLVLDHPAQHFAESFREASRSERADVSVTYWSDHEHGHFDREFDRQITWDVDLLSGYMWYQPGGTTALRKGASSLRLMDKLSPDVVICFGWASPIARFTIIRCVLSGTPLVFYGDTTWQHDSPGIRGLVRALLLRIAFRLAAGALSTGTFNREFYIHLGMHPERVVDGVYPADIATYAAAGNCRSGRDDAKVVIGFAGKLIARKGVDILIRALGRIGDDARWTARIVGDGPERGRLQDLAQAIGIQDRVDFVGFRNTSQMPGELANMDIMVVPSTRDMRVLVVTEAMAAGTAVVVSSNTAVWGNDDHVEDHVTGRIFQSGSADELAAILIDLLADGSALKALEAEGARRAAKHGRTAFTNGLERAGERLRRG